MNPQGEGTPSGSYTGRFVPASIGLVVAVPLVFPLPFMNVAGLVAIPAAFLVLFENGPVELWRRWGPALLTAFLLTGVTLAAGLEGLGIPAVTMVITVCLMDRWIRRRSTWVRVGMAGAAPWLLWAMATLLMVARGADELHTLMQSNMARSIELIQAMGFATEKFEQMVEPAVDLAIRIMPAVVALSAILIGFGALAIAQWWFARRGQPFPVAIPLFTTWELPMALLPVLIAGTLLLLFAEGFWELAGLNVLLVLSVFYLIVGTAIIWYSFEVRGTPGWFRLVFVILLALPPVALAVLVLGVLEHAIPFRRFLAHVAGGDRQENGNSSTEEDER